MMEFLETLNPQQRQAVTAGTGPILALAGPGSGKTRVLTMRIAYLILSMGVRPHEIFAVTFTNKAAREMKERIESFLGESIQWSMWIGTFHALCGRILRREGARIGIDPNFIIMDADDQVALIKRLLKELNIDDKMHKPNVIHNIISNWKNALWLPKDVKTENYKEELYLRVYERYQDSLKRNNALDFDDLLLLSCNLLRDHADIREQYSRRFRYILVDEFQDTNQVQYALLKYLTCINNNIFAVGDEDQSIYRWRGADYRNVLQFEKDYAGCQKILLEQNYRSTQNVLDAARSVIDQNQNRTRKNLFSNRGSGDKIVYYEAEDDRMEARYVVGTISEMIRNGNAKGRDFAVLYRTNAQSRLIEDAFLYRGMPYKLVGAQRFYGRREVKDMIAYLRIVYNPQDELSLLRVINVPSRKIGEKTIQTLRWIAADSQITPGELLMNLGRQGPESPYWVELGSRAATLADFGAIMAEWRELFVHQGSMISIFDKILFDTQYVEKHLKTEEDWEDRFANIEELKNVAFEYEDRGLGEFLQYLALVSDQDTLKENDDAPTLMTLHAAKGLEFNRVFIMGLDDGLLPHSRSQEDPEEMEEERRLFYVGITRAKNHVTLLRAERRMTYGSPEYSTPSRFLSYIPENLLTVQRGKLKNRNQEWGGTSSTRWESKPSWTEKLSSTLGGMSSRATPASITSSSASKPTIAARFKAQDNVTHPMWGDGIIMESKIEDGEEVVQVQFQKAGAKKIIVSLSKLRKA